MITTRKVGGFIIPQRTMQQMIFSAANGLISLFSEKTRVGFMESLEKGIIQEGVLSQATAGPMVMLSLFYDLQNPLFKKHKFDPIQFIEGLVPALENFHNVSSTLENELHQVNQAALSKGKTLGDEEISSETDATDSETSDEVGSVAKEEKESLLSALQMMTDGEIDSKQMEAAKAILNHEWMNEARNHPDSLAAQLSRMVTKELFQINQLSSKTAFLIQNQSKDIHYREGSSRVNNVALLSARACLFREKEASSSDGQIDDLRKTKEYEAIDFNFENDYLESEIAVAAQLEVLYDVTQEFVIGNTESSDSKDIKEVSDEGSPTNSSDYDESTQTTIVSVATFEGWLHGGPDGKLRWKLASYRPPYEFPGIEHAYKY